MLKVKNFKKISETSGYSEEYSPSDEADGRFSLRVNTVRAESKEWPFEMVVSLKVKKSDAETDIFSAKLIFAVDYIIPKKDIEKISIKESQESSWAYCKSAIEKLLQSYDMPSPGLPFALGPGNEESEESE